MQIERSGYNQSPGNTLPLSTKMSEQERAAVEEQVNLINKENQVGGRKIKQQMDKDDFLTLLVTQLKNQDPSAPLEDKQFIAQMAQFSQLEQMNNMGAQFTKMAGMLSSGQAMNTLGRNVEILQGDKMITGRVTQVSSGQFPQILVNGTFYDFKDVSAVKE